MRTVSFVINLSLDGYCDHTLFNPSEEMMDYFTGLFYDVDLIFFGRVMYELMFPYWDDVAKAQSGSPKENAFAEKLSAMNNVVMSTTLTKANANTRIVTADPIGELSKLKQQNGKKILVDSISMLPALVAANLIDEFRLIIHPGIAGRGRQLFPDGSLTETLNLKLIDTITFDNGGIALHYIKI